MLMRLSQQPGISLRVLAQDMGVSLGKAHYCLQSLVDRGWIRANGARRQLTAAGQRARAELVQVVLAQKQQQAVALRAEIAALRRELSRSPADGKGGHAAWTPRS
ncbi:MAG: hypothetical protein RL026_1898 [Pseudomonadota bacterium]